MSQQKGGGTRPGPRTDRVFSNVDPRNDSYSRYVPLVSTRNHERKQDAVDGDRVSRDEVRFPSRRDRDDDKFYEDDGTRQRETRDPPRRGDQAYLRDQSGILNSYSKYDSHAPPRGRTFSRAHEREYRERPRDNGSSLSSRDRYQGGDRYEDRGRSRANDRPQQADYRGYSGRGNGRSDRNKRQRRDEYRNENSQKKSKTSNDDEDSTLSKEELIEKYNSKLQSLQNVKSLEELEVPNSKWGVKKVGFENVSAQEAKVSGHFPLPGSTAIEKETSDESHSSSTSSPQDSKNLMVAPTYKIEPLESRTSKTIVIRGGVDLEKVNIVDLVKYFDGFLGKLDIPETSLNNVVEKRVVKDSTNPKAIIQFKTSTCATVCLALAKKGILTLDILKDSAGSDVNPNEILYLDIVRPEEYVSQCLPPYLKVIEDRVEDVVVDNPRKITLLVDESSTESELIATLREIAPVRSFQLLREIGTKASTGIAFVEFFFDPKKHKNTFTIVSEMEKMIAKMNDRERDNNNGIQRSFLTCVIPGKTGIENCPMDLESLKAMANGDYVTNHSKLKVIQLINCVTTLDLLDNDKFNFIQQDILHECRTFGDVVSIKIPRPKKESISSNTGSSVPGLGKIYVEYLDPQQALNAIMGLAGRQYNEKTVICAFHSYEDYANGLL